MPHFKTKHNLYLIALPIIFASLISLSACLNDSVRRTPPKAKKGVLNLTNWDFKNDGPVDLSGEWAFYWQQHLLPDDFAQQASRLQKQFIEVPGYWKGYEIEGKKLPGFGYATYRLLIHLNSQDEPFALRIREVQTAYRIFVDGQSVGSLGLAAKDFATTVPQQFPQVFDFEIRANQMELIIQVSNFHHRRGGAWEVIQLGREIDIRKAQEKGTSFDLFLFGSIFIMALYHLGLFVVRKKDRSPLFFSIFCFLIALRLLTTGERYLIHLFPNIQWELMIKLEYLSFYLAVPVFVSFMRSIFPRFSKRILRLIQLLALGFACVVLLTPVRLYSHTIHIYEVFTVLCLIYGLYIIITSLMHKNIEALILLIGFIIFGMTVVNDMLHVERIIQTGFLTPLGLFIFILSQAFLLSFRFSTALVTVETQQIELRDTLESYKAEIIDRVQAEEALRESEEKYRTILHSIEEGYYEVDLAGNLTFFNDSLRRHLGYSKNELMGMNNRQYMSAATAKNVYQTFNTVLKTGQAAKAFDWEMIAKDGSKKIVELSVSLIRDSAGQPSGFRGVARDVSERRKAEEQAKLHQQQLMQASKMVALGTLVSGVAHEINNPNNFIMLNSPLLKEAWKNAMPILDKYYEENGDFILGGIKFSEMRENIPRLFAGISEGSKRIKRIVDDLKNYVRNDTADLTQSVDINTVIKSAVSLLTNMIKNTTHNFSIEKGNDLPVLKGNFQRLEQVIINLIQNACQALPDNSKGIFISTGYDQQKSNIVITIRDEGVGIAPETLMLILDPFFTTKDDVGGVGLGLSISSRIVEEHSGTLSFTSEPGAGTTATITLPIDREKQTVEGNP